ncbi:MAG: protein kinase [Polyangiaceae bacterium]
MSIAGGEEEREPVSVLPGERLGPFEIELEAGRGGMGYVYRARDLRTGLPVALKVLHRGAEPSRFEREAKLLAFLNHPHIVRYVGHGFDQGFSFLAMEWLEGEDLGRRLKRGKLDVATTIELGRAVAEALAHAHARGVVHRDIKPSNLLLPSGDAARVKIVDFGVAFDPDASRVTHTGATLGTPRYMAPEQARGDPSAVSGAADLFSLGCVIFECLTGRSPFQASHPMASLAKILLEPAPSPLEFAPDAPAALGALTSRLLAKDPSKRANSAEAVADAFADLAAQPITAQPVARARPSSMPPRGGLSASGLELASVLVIGRSTPSRPPPAAAAQSDSGRTGGSDELATRLTARPWSVPALARVASSFEAEVEVLAKDALVLVLRGAVATDLAARAASCAIALHDTAGSLAIGLATGRADLAGRVPMGEAIDRAVALMRASLDDGAIHLDEATDGLLDDRFERSPAPCALEDARATHTILGRFRDVDVVRTLLGKPTPFVGREAELAALVALFEQCRAEEVARAALVIGPAGIGKTRLRRELLAKIAAPNRGGAERMGGGLIEVWVGRADSFGARSAYGLVARALSEAIGLRAAEPIEARRQKIRARVERHLSRSLAQQGDSLPSLRSAHDLNPGSAQRVTAFLSELLGAPLDDRDNVQLAAARRDAVVMHDQIRRAFIDFLEAETRATPVVLALEDLHAGDPPSLELVDGALRVLAERPLFVLAFARTEIDDVFPQLFRDRDVHRIVLAPLPRRAAQRLASAVLGQRLDADAIAELVEQSAGNAFFLEELVRAAADGRTERAPATVVAMVEARLAALPHTERRVLRAASVFGQVFWQGAVQALLGEGADDPRAALAGLLERELIVRHFTSRYSGETEFAFRHAIVREAVYAMLTDEDRALGHALAGDWLERAGEARADALAEHFGRGGQQERALEHIVSAAESALAANDFAGALEWVERGYGSGASGVQLGELLRVQAEAHKWRGEHQGAEARGLLAMKRLSFGSDAWFSAAGEVLVASLRLGRIDRLDEVVAEVRAAIGEHPRTAAVSAVARAASALLHAGRASHAAELLRLLDALEPHATADPAASGRIAHARATQALVSGDASGYLARMTVAARAFDEVGDLRMACNARVGLGFAMAETGDFDEAEQVLRAAIQDADHLGLALLAETARLNLGHALARRGAIKEALPILERATKELAKQSDKRMESAARAYLAHALADWGELERALAEATKAVTIAPSQPARARALAAQAFVMLAARDLAGAGAAADEAVKILDKLGGVDGGDAFIRLVHVECCLATQRAEQARAAIRVAAKRLDERAARIADEDLRRRFLTRVPENRRTLELAEELRRARSSKRPRSS